MVLQKKFNKVRDHCLLTGKHRGPVHENSNRNIKQKQSKFNPRAIPNFSKYGCHLFFNKFFDMKEDEMKVDIIPQKNGEYISITYDCIRFLDKYWFLSSSLDRLTKSLIEIKHESFKSFRGINS